MLSDRIKALVRDFNPWWDGKAISAPDYRRHVFASVQKHMRTKQIIAITGLRRVGKTVLMMQLIKDLVELKKERAENVFYFLFDELVAQNPDALEEILDHYMKTIAKEGKKYVFLDEIHKVPYWQDILKRFYDLKPDMKFIVSGSASLQIKRSKESLAGRMYDFYMPILSYREFLELNGLNIEKSKLEFKVLKRVYEANLHRRPMLHDFLLRYIHRGAFPEMAKEEDAEIIKNYVKNSVIEKILFEDIPTVFDVRRKDVLSALLEYCSKETSNLLDLTSLANTLNVNYQTVKSYIFYLHHSFVVDIVYNYSRSIAKQLRKNKKVHIAHPTITVTMMRYPREILDVEEITGKYVESIVYQHSKSLCERISFWRTPQKDEVDVVLELDPLLPIEVKYRKHVELSDVKSVIRFMQRFGSKRGIVVTKDTLEEKTIDGKKLLFVPAWLFLLSV